MHQRPHPIEVKQLKAAKRNGCGIRTNKAEFAAALNYIKPDLVCGSESWFRGIKLGQDPAKNTIKSSEVFNPEYTFHRNDRTVDTGGVYLPQPTKASSLMHNLN